MNRVRAIVEDERGVAVVVALVALVTLTALVLAFLAVGALEPQISANFASATQARHVAEAGVEAAFDQLALLLVNPANVATAWDAALVGATCAQGAIVPNTQASQTLPGLTSASGTFTVRVRNDCLAADSTLTGVAVEANATADTNSRLIVTSIGTVGTATKTVTAVVKRVALPTINGALAFPGVESDDQGR